MLRLNLSQPSTVELESEAGSRSSLKGAEGELVLQLHPPLQLRIQPAPAATAVSWNDQPLPGVPGQEGRYRVGAVRP